MSWLSQFIHNPGDMIKHHPWKALSLIGAPIAAIAAPFVAPAIGGALGLGGAAAAEGGLAAGAGLGALEEAGAVGAGLAGETALAGGEGALGLGTFGSEALGFAPEGASAFAGAFPESIPGGFLEAGAGSPASFYDAVGMGAGAPASTAGAGVTDFVGPLAGGPAGASDFVGPTLSGMGPSEMAAGAPFAESPIGQAMVNAGLVPPNASPGMWGSAMNWIKANPMMAATLGLGGLGLAKNLIGGIPNQGALKGIAGQEGQMAAANAAQGQNLLGPIEGGPLPPALEQQVLNGVKAADAATKSRFASLGLSGSTMESDALNNNQNQAQALRGTLALQLAQAGAQLIGLANQELGMQAGIFTNLMNAQIAQDSALEQAIARFAGSAAMASAISSRKAA